MTTNLSILLPTTTLTSSQYQDSNNNNNNIITTSQNMSSSSSSLSSYKQTSPTLPNLKDKKRRNSGRYLLWEKPPASFSPYIKTLKLSHLSSSGSLQSFIGDNIDSLGDEENGEKEEEIEEKFDHKHSVLGCICARILLILKGFFSDFNNVKTCISSFRNDDILSSISIIDPLLDMLFFTSERNGDSGLQLVQLEVLSALESFFVTASLSRALLDRIPKMHVIERLTDIISQKELCHTVSNRAIALLAQLLCTSSRLTNSLVKTFRSYGGYNVLRKAFVAELDKTRGDGQRNRKRRKALLKVLHLLLYVGLDEPGNLDAIRLLIKLFVDVTDSFKNDLLSTLKGAVYIQKELGVSTILAELFRLFDTVPSIEDRVTLLSVVDETMTLKNADPELLKAYCSLIENGKRPSTVVLAINHMNKMILSGILSKESLERVDFLSVLHPYFVPPNGLPIRKVTFFSPYFLFIYHISYLIEFYKR